MILDIHYRNTAIGEKLLETLGQIKARESTPPLFICIGSDRHIIDCFGPLIGTMVREENPRILLYGHLEAPLHATSKRSILNFRHPDNFIIAIDASVGTIEDIGNIKVRQGPIIPGKALAKKLPPVGDYAITGVLGSNQERNIMIGSNQGSLAAVYPMAQIIAGAICGLYQQGRD